ncbi:MAG: RNA polymerase sigma factor RpoD/SigA [Spirochaetia bacterium]|nr:RNA polymerase sigma factor RpoD/SigA [Spirochaetia bacterium]
MKKSETGNNDNLLTLYLNDVKRYPLLTPEEETDLARKAVSGDVSAREKLINSHLRFVVSVAKQYENTGYGLMDLINEGNLGLLSAVEKYDPERGYHFISYAVWWIRQSILKAVNEKSRAIRLPLNRVNELLQIEKAMKELGLVSPGNEDWDRLSEQTGLEPDLIRQLVEVSRSTVSLDAPVSSGKGGEESEFGELIADSSYLTPEASLEDAALKDEINRVLALLPQKEAEILEMRFGLNGKMEMSLSDISEIYNLTKERIRQIEQKALNTLRNSAAVSELKAYRA